MGCFSLNSNLYGTIAQHGCSQVQKRNTLALNGLVSLAYKVYCELDVNVNRVQMLVEKFFVCSPQTYVGVVHIPRFDLLLTTLSKNYYRHILFSL